VLSPPYQARLFPLSSRLVSYRSFQLLLFRSPYPAPPEGFGLEFRRGHRRGTNPPDGLFRFGVFSMENINVD
jgi:hypothetical protein